MPVLIPHFQSEIFKYRLEKTSMGSTQWQKGVCLSGGGGGLTLAGAGGWAGGTAACNSCWRRWACVRNCRPLGRKAGGETGNSWDRYGRRTLHVNAGFFCSMVIYGDGFMLSDWGLFTGGLEANRVRCRIDKNKLSDTKRQTCLK